MHRIFLTLVACALVTAQAGSQGQPAGAAQPEQVVTTKVDGTDNVYTYRIGNSQSMFIVTNDGVIATDPVGYGRPQGGATYLAEIRKVTSQPIRYLVYSHHHFDHIAGGRAFKEAGARIIAHRRAKERLEVLNDPNTVLPDEAMDGRRTLTLGGTALELTYAGQNHSDSTLVMRLPKERIVFVVDLLPVGQVPGRGMIDFYPLQAEASIKQILAMDWDRLIPGHPGRWRPTGHEEGRAGSAHVPAGRFRGREGGSAAGTLLGAGRKHGQASEVRELAELRGQPAIRPAALLPALGPRHVDAQAGSRLIGCGRVSRGRPSRLRRVRP